MIALTLPGCKLVHYGQNLGFSIKLPVQLGRYPSESPKNEIQKIYDSFIQIIVKEIPLNGTWKLIDVNDPLIVYYWKGHSTYSIIFCNYSGYSLEDAIDLDYLFGKKVRIEEILVESIFSRKYKNRDHENFKLNEHHINLRLYPWEFLILKVIFR